jgi:hypothetical protein
LSPYDTDNPRAANPSVYFNAKRLKRPCDNTCRAHLLKTNLWIGMQISAQEGQFLMEFFYGFDWRAGVHDLDQASDERSK